MDAGRQVWDVQDRVSTARHHRSGDAWEGPVMFHPMPWRYRLLVWFSGLLSFCAVGIWVALATPVPLMWSTGAVLGVVLGVAAVTYFLQSLSRDQVEDIRRTPHTG
jgi:hypothetical protein